MKIQLCNTLSVDTKRMMDFIDDGYNRRMGFNEIKKALQKYKLLPKVKKGGRRYLGNTQDFWITNNFSIYQYHNRFKIGCKEIPLKNVDKFIKLTNILKNK